MEVYRDMGMRIENRQIEGDEQNSEGIEHCLATEALGIEAESPDLASGERGLGAESPTRLPAGTPS
jgi:hypothetical protein